MSAPKEPGASDIPKLKPILILIHGAWHRPIHLEPIATSLHAHGYLTHSPALPSVSDGKSVPIPLTSHSLDTAVVRAIVAHLVDQGHELVLFVHSYGGIPASDAVVGLTRRDRSRENLPGGVVHIVWCAASALVEGQSLVDSVVAATSAPDWFEVADLPTEHGQGAGMVATVKPKMEVPIFYQDISNEDGRIDAAIQQIGAHAAQTFMSKQMYSAWRDVSGTYIQTLDDHCNKYQQNLILNTVSKEKRERKLADGVTMNVVSIPGGHSPWLRPEGLETVVNVIRRSAGEVV